MEEDSNDCFDLICTGYCITCRYPVQTNKQNAICENCFFEAVQDARHADLFGPESWWKQGLTPDD